MRELPQQEHADLGLIPDTDQTEDLRPTKNASGGAGTPAGGDLNTPTAK